MEGLRGLAVGLVFLVHFATLSKPWVVSGGALSVCLEVIHSMGNAGVDLFFLLSGYLIYGTLIDKATDLAPYFRRRMRRIYPTFLVVFSIYVVLTQLQPEPERKIPEGTSEALVYLIQNLLLLPGLLPIEPLVGVAWSLSYEVFYYLVLPLVIGAFGLRRLGARQRFVYCALLSIGALVLFASFGGPVRLVLFLSGILVFECQRAWPARAPGDFGALVAVVVALALMVPAMPGPAGQALRAAILFLGFALLCWQCFARPFSGLGQVFSWTPLRWLGNMSYSFYLIHGLALKVFFTGVTASGFKAASDLAVMLALLPALAFCLVVSAVLFLCVERPFSLAKTNASAPQTATDSK